MKHLLHLGMLILLLVAAGCAANTSAPAAIEGASVNSPLNQTVAGSDMFFTVAVAKDGDPIGIYFNAAVTKGSLRAQLLDPSGKLVWSETAQTGNTAFNTTYVQTQAGDYRLGIAWDGPVEAQYALVWKPHMIEPPSVSPLALVPGAGMLLVGLAFVLYALLRRLGWKYLVLGAAFWVLTVALKFAWSIPVNSTVYSVLKTLGDPGLWVFYLYVGALTGAFEVGVTYLILSRRDWGRVPWSRALSFGIGFGAFEALLLALGPLVSVLAAWASPSLFPLATLQSVAALNNVIYGVAPVWERFFTIWVHIFSCVLIFYAIAKRSLRPFWIAFLFKTLFDTVAAFAQVSGFLSGSGDSAVVALWIIELLLAPFGLLGIWGTRRLAPRYPKGEISGVPGIEPVKPAGLDHPSLP